MTVLYATTVKTNRMDATRSFFASGSLELLGSTGAGSLATFALNATGGTISTGAWTILFTSSSTTGTALASTGTSAVTAQMKNAAGVASLTNLSVGAGTGDVNLNNVSIASGQSVTLTSAVITHAA